MTRVAIDALTDFRRVTMFRMWRELKTIYTLQWEAYQADCERDYRRGYRAHYCEHGTNQWTDYDNICGPCEDGETNGDPWQRSQRALEVARYRYERATRLFDFHSEAFDLRVGHLVDTKTLFRMADALLNPLREWTEGKPSFAE